MKYLLESIEDIGKLTVTRSKDCGGYKWKIEWNNGGDQSEIKVNRPFSFNLILNHDHNFNAYVYSAYK